MTRLAIIAALVLSGCLGLDAHRYDMADKIGSTRIVTLSDGRTVKVRFEHATTIMSDGPCAKYMRTEGYGCSLWPNGEKLTPLAVKLLDGHDGLIWTPPNSETFEHELEHVETKSAGIHLN